MTGGRIPQSYTGRFRSPKKAKVERILAELPMLRESDCSAILSLN
jgi:hypothetical protein